VVEASVLRSTIVGADSSTVLNVPMPGPDAISPRWPVPQLANIPAIRWDGYSVFNGLTLRAEQRLSHGLAFLGSYTLSKATDDASDPGATSFETNLPQDVRNMAAERALASFDHRHRFVGNATWALPPIGGAFGSNWRVNAIVNLQSGAPFTVNLGTDHANIGSGPAQRPDVAGDPNIGGAGPPNNGSTRLCFRCLRHSHLAIPVAIPCERRAMPTSTRACRRTSFSLEALVWNCAGRFSISSTV